MAPTWETTTDWDSPQSETGVHHEQPANTDWAPSDQIEKGYPSSDENGASLTAYWPHDEDSGTTAVDVANGNNATLSGTTVNNADGIAGGSTYYFDGTDDEWDLSAGSLGNPGTFSLSLWVRPENSPSGILQLFTTASYSNGNFHLFIESGNFLVDFDQANVELVSTTTVSDATWYHIAAVIDRSTPQHYLYINGTQEASSTSSASNDFDGLRQINAGYWNQSGTPKRHFRGHIDEIRFYQRALSSTDVSNLYNAPL